MKAKAIKIFLISIFFSSCGLQTFTGNEISFDSELWRTDSMGSNGYRDSILWFGDPEALDCDTLFIGQSVKYLKEELGQEDELWRKGRYDRHLSYIYFIDGECRDSCSDQQILVLKTKRGIVKSAYRGSITCPGNCPPSPQSGNCGSFTPHPVYQHPTEVYCE